MSEKFDPQQHIGYTVVVESPSGERWEGVALGYQDRPSLLISSDGKRLMLPAAWARLPEPPKPWHDAKPGEVWVLTGAGGLEQPWRRTDRGRWLSCTTGKVEYNDEHAIAGRRIWPEGE